MARAASEVPPCTENQGLHQSQLCYQLRLQLWPCHLRPVESFWRPAAASPRWNEKFDFIDVPATSFLTATVYNRSSVIESRLSMTPWKAVRALFISKC